MGVDFILGPDMKSTGEVLGLGKSFAEALSKAVYNPFVVKDKDNVVISVANREKAVILPIALELNKRGFNIYATKGTARYLSQNGIEVCSIEGHIEIVKMVKTGEVSAIINIPNQGRIDEKLGFKLRALAVQNRIPLFTCLDTVQSLIDLPDVIEYQISPINGETQLIGNEGVKI
jgi:carbamoyl-phosphate synthase large subunit